MPKSVIVDLETLSAKPSAAVLSMGVVVFDFDSELNFKKLVDSGLYLKFNVIDQVKRYARRIDKSTVDWWKKQGDAALAVTSPSSDDVTIVEGFDLLNKFLTQSGYSYKEGFVLSRGSNFDFPIIESMAESIGTLMPMNTWKIRCLKTMFDVLTGRGDGSYTPRGGLPPEFIMHNSLHDAAMDAYRCIDLYQLLNEGSDDAF